MEDNKGYPKFQYSIFLRDNRDEQLVIRTDTFEELLEAKKDIDKIITKREQKAIPVEEFQQKCERCGADKILSRKGNMVCKDFCWTKRG